MPHSIRFHLAAVFLLFFVLVVRARLIQHLAAEQLRPAVGRRRRGLAADHAGARRSQQLHLRLPRHRGQQSAVVGSGRNRCDREADGRARPLHCRGRARFRRHPRTKRPKTSSIAQFKARWNEYRTIVNQMLGAVARPTARPRRWRSMAARRAPPITPRAIRSAN